MALNLQRPLQLPLRVVLLLLWICHFILWITPTSGQYLVVNPLGQESTSPSPRPMNVPSGDVVNAKIKDDKNNNNNKTNGRIKNNILTVLKPMSLTSSQAASIPEDIQITWPDEVKFGVILPYGLYNFPYVSQKIYPSILMGISNVMNRPDLLPGVNLTTTLEDSRCSDQEGPLAAIDMYLGNKVHVFFGPACDYPLAPVARFQTVWKIPVISTVLYSAFQDKQNYPMLTGVIGGYDKLGPFFWSIWQRFKWEGAGFIFHKSQLIKGPLFSDECLQLIRPIYEMVIRSYGTVAPYSTFARSEDVTDWEPHLRKVANNSRSEYITSLNVIVDLSVVCFQ